MEQLRIPEATISMGNHVSTTWEIATDQIFSNIVFQEIESIESKLILNIPGTLNKETIYFARARRHFDDNTSGNWLPYATINVESGFGLNTYDVDYGNVETPTVFIDKAKWFDDTITEVTIRTSKIRTNKSAHKATTWILYGDDNEIIYKSINDEVNLESLTISKDILNIHKHNTFIIKALHTNTHGLSSEFAVYDVPLHESVLRIGGNFRDLPYTIDHTYNLIWGEYVVIRELLSVNVKDRNDNTVMLLENVTDNNFIVPAGTLDSGETYTIDIVTKTSGIYESKTFTININTSATDYEYTISPFYIYDHAFTSGLFTESQNMRSKWSIEMLRDYNVIYGVDNGNKLYIGRFNKTTGRVENTSVADFITIGADAHFNVLEIDHYRAFIDTADYLGNRVFALAEFDVFSGLLQVRYIETLSNEETYDIGFNAITHHKGTNYIYFESNSLNTSNENIITTKRFDILTRTVEDIPTRPGGIYTNGTLEYIGNGKILALGSTTGTYNGCFIYDITNESWDNIVALPDEFIGESLVSGKLKNGDIAYFKETGMLSGHMVFDTETHEITVIYPSESDAPIKGILLPHSGDLYITDANNDSKYYIYS